MVLESTNAHGTNRGNVALSFRSTRPELGENKEPTAFARVPPSSTEINAGQSMPGQGDRCARPSFLVSSCVYFSSGLARAGVAEEIRGLDIRTIRTVGPTLERRRPGEQAISESAPRGLPCSVSPASSSVAAAEQCGASAGSRPGLPC